MGVSRGESLSSDDQFISTIAVKCFSDASLDLAEQLKRRQICRRNSGISCHSSFRQNLPFATRDAGITRDAGNP
jgi:hypothetical protein